MASYARNNAQLHKLLLFISGTARSFSFDFVKGAQSTEEHTVREQEFLTRVRAYVADKKEIESSIDNLPAFRVFVKLNSSTLAALMELVMSTSDTPFDNSGLNGKFHDIAFYDLKGNSILETVTHEDLLIPHLSASDLAKLKKDGIL